jgi:phage tail tape-measure protein
MNIKVKATKIDDFWRIKHQIDDEVARLGWSKARAKGHIEQVYRKSSRLVMSDEQLLHLLEYLQSLPTPTRNNTTSKTTSRKRKKRRD